jgi:hypothetical protein
MGVLANTKHEAFAQARFKGETIDAAYVTAGFSPNRGNAARLNAKESILARITELMGEAANQATKNIAFDAVSQFKRLEHQITLALLNGNDRVAMEGRRTMLEAFGWLDSPTLTQEQVLGRKVAKDEEAPTDPNAPLPANVVAPRFGKFLKALERKL